MKPKQVTIPSAFIPMDTNVTAADSVVNVHDQHVFRQNHNSLLAQRVRKDLVAQVATGVASGSFGYWDFKTRFPPDGEGHSRILSMPLYVTQMTKQLRFWCRACKTNLNGASALAEDPVLYLVAREPQIAYMGDLTTNALAITSAASTPAFASITVNLPALSGEHSTHFGRTPYILDVYLKAFIDDTHALHAGTALSDVGVTSFRAAHPGAGMGDVIYTSAAANEPRMITKRSGLAGDDRYFIDTPWSEMPNPGADTITGREILGVQLWSYGVQELPITDLTAEHAL